MDHRQSPGSAQRQTLGANKVYYAFWPIAELRQAFVTPHVAQKARYSAIDAITTQREGYALSVKHQKRIEDAIGWAKTAGRMAQTMYRGAELVRSRFILTMAANNLAPLLRLPAA